MNVSASDFFRVKGDDIGLAVAQKTALTKQIPLMYFILLVNTWGLAFTHSQVAPRELTLYAPGAMSVVCVLRIVLWGVRNRRPAIHPGHAIRELRRTNTFAWLLSALFSCWGIALTRYGDGFLQSHVAFYMGITVIGCIFCLTHLFSAALAVSIVTNSIFIAYFGMTGNDIFIAMTIDVGLVSSAMLIVLWVQYRDFQNLIVSRRDLQEKKDDLEIRELQLVEEQQQTQALSDENRMLANVDSLTGLANRRMFFSELDEMLQTRPSNDHPLYLGLIDLDGFKPVNDLHGHRVGDDLLVTLASRFQDICYGKALVARLGGDEFGFLFQSEDPHAVKSLANEICVSAKVPFIISGAFIEISASIGVASTEIGEPPYNLYEQADFALYSAKRDAPGAAIAFTQEHNRRLSRMVVIDQAFRDGSINDQIELAFQPIYDLAQRRISGFEALARWQHKSLGSISPEEFIPAAERSGQIHHLSRILLAKALAEAANWPEDVGLSFNLSARDFSSADQAARLLEIILDSRIAPDRLDLEITETAVLTDPERSKSIADAFRQAGLGISLDDFGTGYSSLTHLHSMPLDRIKIDRSFVTEINKNASSAKIVKSLIRMAHDMELECVIEGVETAEEMSAVQNLGGKYVQGYFISKPLCSVEAQDLLKKRNALPGQPLTKV